MQNTRYHVAGVSLLVALFSNTLWGATTLPSSNAPYFLQNLPTGNPFTVLSGSIINTAGTSISGDNSSNWILNNFGTVTGGISAIALASNSVVTNAGVIQGGTGAAVSFTGNFNNILINTGDIIAGSSGIAIQSDGGNDLIVMQGGTITGNIQQGDGIDNFIMTGGTIIGTIDQGGDLDNFEMYGGTITGDVNNGDTMLMAGGRILGTVNLFQANNVYVMTGGLIGGDVTAVQGNDRFSISGGQINGTVNLGNGNNNVTIIGGRINNGITLGNGTDQITWMNGGIVTGAIRMGTGNNTMTLSNLNNSHLANVTVFDGGEGATSLLQFNQVNTSGIARFQNWERIIAANQTQLTMDGNLILGDATTLTGSLDIDSSSSLLAGNGTHASILPALASQLAVVTNAGTINLTNGLASATDTFTIVGNYIGNDGRLLLDSVLQGDNSPSDKLIISNGLASGSTAIAVTNLNGSGSFTAGDGILVVEAINGANTTANAFTLAAPVMAGPYEYTLYKGNVAGTLGDNWYLRSSILSPDSLTFIPNYRQEVSLYTALPSTSVLYGRTILDTLQQRIGDEQQLNTQQLQNKMNGSWVRVINQKGNWDSTGIYHNGPSFDYHFQALEAGMDVYRDQHADGSRDYAGVYGAHGKNKGTVYHFNQLAAGQDQFDAYTLGLYWTHFGTNDWYVDAIVQNNWFNYQAISGRVPRLRPNGYQPGASLEGGYPFKITASLRLEPQAQAVYQSLSMSSAHDGLAQVNFDRTQGLAGRLGLRLANNWLLPPSGNAKIQHKITAWLRASAWRQNDSKSITQFSSDTGFLPFVSDLSGNWIQTDLGVTAQLTDAMSLYGTLGRDFFLNGHGKAYNAIGGIKVLI